MEMPYNPSLYHRRSIRLKGYDYSQEGLYFVTICCHNRECLFGKIVDGEMILKDAGKIADDCWQEIPKHFPNAILHEYVVKPNHILGIVQFVGANQYSPNDNSPKIDDNDDMIRAKDFSPLRRCSPSKTIGSIVRGYKIGVTKWMRQNTDVYDVWQRNYYEHIIRNEQSLKYIIAYIVDNPNKWNVDKYFNG